MVKLTIPMIESRGKGLDYQQIIHLNLWGTELHDINVFLEMPRLEILSLSLNKLVRLDGLRNCHKLQELYLRKNLIDSVDELVHLKNAKNLQIFTLLENPVATILGDNYRPSVLRMLPQLTNLDGLDVRPSEVWSAEEEERTSQIEPIVVTPEQPSNSKRAAAIARREEYNRELERERQRDLELERKRNGIRASPPDSPMRGIDQEQLYIPDCSSNDSASQKSDLYKMDTILSRPRSKSAFHINGRNVRQSTLVGSNPLQVPRCTQTEGYVDHPNYYRSYDLPSRSFAETFRNDEMDFMHYRTASSLAPSPYGYHSRNMVPNAGPNYYRVPKPSGPMRSNANLLSTLRNLIRELEPASLMILSQAIHEQMEEMPHTE